MTFPSPRSRCRKPGDGWRGTILVGPYAGYVTVQWDRKKPGPVLSPNNNGIVESYVPLSELQPDLESEAN